MPTHYSSIVALLASVFILIAGNGLVTTLVPLTATSEDFSQIAIGASGSAYFAGMLLGSIASPWTIRRAGHIRAFAAFAAIAPIATLIFPIHVNVFTLALLRAVHGFCFAGLSTPDLRGGETGTSINLWSDITRLSTRPFRDSSVWWIASTHGHSDGSRSCEHLTGESVVRSPRWRLREQRLRGRLLFRSPARARCG